MIYFSIIKAEYLSGYKVKLFFYNKKNGLVDLKDYIENREIFSKLINLEEFKNFKVEYRTLTWCDGEMECSNIKRSSKF